MSIDVKPETERLVQEQIRSGHFQSVDDLILQGIQAWREKSLREGALETSPDARRRAAARIRELRKGVRLERNGLTLREYAHLGHRY
jgi:Arc/MetJ-type ribon-helix-helix transcriptional regulator